ncbi:MAG TPA: pyridoxamine kinase [Lachnospiraceae bacterium]|nr:pyridoxamine kinase [Lachnospiraceae bacterium]
MKRIVTIQDISCVGKCSLTVALPIISAMGVETAILPTAVLSTHTMFSGFTCKDMTDQIIPIAEHWKKEKFGFDAIYTGYLGSFEQIEIVSKLFDEFKTDSNLIIVDPVMADNGKLYPAFDEAYARENAKLCGKADLIVPNLTEASFLTGMPYRTTYDRKYITDMLEALAKLGPKYVALTGVSFEEGKIGVMGLDTENGAYFEYYTEHVPVSYHGTGDIFSSVVVGALTRGKSLPEAFRIACDYTKETIAYTWHTVGAGGYGVDFEVTLPKLVQRMQ